MSAIMTPPPAPTAPPAPPAPAGLYGPTAPPAQHQPASACAPADSVDAAALPDPPAPAPAPQPRERKALRLAALALLTVALIVAGRASGLAQRLEGDGLRTMVEEAGWLGPPLFVALFALGELVHIPGLVFVAGGVLAYGKAWGGVLGFAAAIISVSVSFLVVRLVGGKALAGAERPLLRWALGHLEARPLLTIFWLRTLFFMAPPLNYALALSPVRFGPYLVGSAIGMAGPMVLAAVAFDWLFRQNLPALARGAWPYALAVVVAAALAWAGVALWRRHTRARATAYEAAAAGQV